MKFLRACSIVLTLLFVAAPVFAGGIHSHIPAGLAPTDVPPLPGSFQGIWSYTEILKDCTTQTVLQILTGTDTVCADGNSAIPDTIGLGNFICDGTSTANQYNITCTGSQEITPGCVQHFSITIASTLSGSTVNSVTTVASNYTGCDIPFPPSCASFEYTGTRIGPATEECATPVQPTTWSGVKAYYR